MKSFRSLNRVSGFTIIELLIVIVIIGILVAITAVSYSGLSKSANESSAKSTAKQVSNKVTIAYTENGVYPANLSDIGISDSSNTTFQHSSTSNTWCTTVTVGNSSVYVSNLNSNPTNGGCPGHGQNGVAAITNLSFNPGAESNNAWYNNGSNPTGTWSTTVKRSGNQSREAHNTTTGTSLLSLYAVGGSDGNGSIVPPGKTYSISLYFRSDVPHTGRISCNFRSQPSGTWGSSVTSSTITGTSGSWTRATLTGCIAPADADRMRVGAYVVATSSQPANTSAWVDDFMITEGPGFPDYADGNSPNWVWNGTPNASTSTGPI